MIITNGIEWNVFCAVQQFRIPSTTLSEKLDPLLQWTDELNQYQENVEQQCQCCSIVSMEESEAMLYIFYWESIHIEEYQRTHQKVAQEMFSLELTAQLPQLTQLVHVQLYKLFAHALKRKLKSILLQNNFLQMGDFFFHKKQLSSFQHDKFCKLGALKDAVDVIGFTLDFKLYNSTSIRVFVNTSRKQLQSLDMFLNVKYSLRQESQIDSTTAAFLNTDFNADSIIVYTSLGIPGIVHFKNSSLLKFDSFKELEQYLTNHSISVELLGTVMQIPASQLFILESTHSHSSKQNKKEESSHKTPLSNKSLKISKKKFDPKNLLSSTPISTHTSSRNTPHSPYPKNLNGSSTTTSTATTTSALATPTALKDVQHNSEPDLLVLESGSLPNFKTTPSSSVASMTPSSFILQNGVVANGTPTNSTNMKTTPKLEPEKPDKKKLVKKKEEEEVDPFDDKKFDEVFNSFYKKANTPNPSAPPVKQELPDYVPRRKKARTTTTEPISLSIFENEAVDEVYEPDISTISNNLEDHSSNRTFESLHFTMAPTQPQSIPNNERSFFATNLYSTNQLPTFNRSTIESYKPPIIGLKQRRVKKKKHAKKVQTEVEEFISEGDLQNIEFDTIPSEMNAKKVELQQLSMNSLVKLAEAKLNWAREYLNGKISSKSELSYALLKHLLDCCLLDTTVISQASKSVSITSSTIIPLYGQYLMKRVENKFKVTEKDMFDTLYSFFNILKQQKQFQQFWKGPYIIPEQKFSTAVCKLTNPLVRVGYSEQWVDVSPQAIALWEKLLFEPYAESKKVRYIILGPESIIAETRTKHFFANLSTMYQMCRLGTHLPCSIFPDGFVGIEWNNTTDSEANFVDALSLTISNLANQYDSIKSSLQKGEFLVFYLLNPCDKNVEFKMIACMDALVKRFFTPPYSSAYHFPYFYPLHQDVIREAFSSETFSIFRDMNLEVFNMLRRTPKWTFGTLLQTGYHSSLMYEPCFSLSTSLHIGDSNEKMILFCGYELLGYGTILCTWADSTGHILESAIYTESAEVSAVFPEEISTDQMKKMLERSFDYMRHFTKFEWTLVICKFNQEMVDYEYKYFETNLTSHDLNNLETICLTKIQSNHPVQFGLDFVKRTQKQQQQQQQQQQQSFATPFDMDIQANNNNTGATVEQHKLDQHAYYPFVFIAENASFVELNPFTSTESSVNSSLACAYIVSKNETFHLKFPHPPHIAGDSFDYEMKVKDIDRVNVLRVNLLQHYQFKMDLQASPSQTSSTPSPPQSEQFLLQLCSCVYNLCWLNTFSRYSNQPGFLPNFLALLHSLRQSFDQYPNQ